MGGLGSQAIDALARPDAQKALDFGGKFNTQGEREAEFAMEQAEWGWGDDLSATMSTVMQYFQMGGDPKADLATWKNRGVTPPAGQNVVSTPTSTEPATATNLWDSFTDPQSWIPEATAAFLVSQHGGFGGSGESESSTSSSDESVTEDTVSPGYDNTSADQEYQEWLASMGITSPIYNNNGLS